MTDYLNLVTDDAYCHPMFQSPTSFKNVQQLYYQNWFNTSKDTCQFDFLKILMHRSTLFSLQNFHYIFFKDKSSTVDISSNLPWWNLFKCQSNRTFNILYAWGIGINWGGNYCWCKLYSIQNPYPIPNPFDLGSHLSIIFETVLQYLLKTTWYTCVSSYQLLWTTIYELHLIDID